MNTVAHSMERVEKTIKLAEWSLVFFLALHSYNNGNGRIGWLLVDYVLSSIFPFNIPACDTITREEYLMALIKTQNCPCDCDAAGVCSTYDDVFINATPGLISTMILDSCWSACHKFQQSESAGLTTLTKKKSNSPLF